MAENIPSLAPDDLGTEFYFVGRCEEADYRTEVVERKDGSGSFTSRSVVIRWARLGEIDETGKQRELTTFFNYPQMGKVNPNSPLGQFSLACRDAGTVIRGGNTNAERSAGLKALEQNIYVVLARSEVSPGSSRSKLYTFPVKLVGKGAAYDTDEVQAYIDSLQATVPTEAEEEADTPTVTTGGWQEFAPALIEVAVGKTKQEAVLAMSNYANKQKLPQAVRVAIATAKVVKAMEDEGYIQVVDDKIVAG